jgi:hypothetical protein
VNVNLMKALDGPTKGKVIPQLMPRALWWFRWGALITVLVGLMYYAMYILKSDAHNANANLWMVFLVWFLIPVVAFAIEMVMVKRGEQRLGLRGDRRITGHRYVTRDYLLDQIRAWR